MRNILALAALGAGLVTGCTSLRDARGPSEICEVHHSMMNTVEVPGPGGKVELDREYVETGTRLFPHCYPDYPPDHRHHLVIYVCNDCVRLQREWKRTHQTIVPASPSR